MSTPGTERELVWLELTDYRWELLIGETGGFRSSIWVEREQPSEAPTRFSARLLIERDGHGFVGVMTLPFAPEPTLRAAQVQALRAVEDLAACLSGRP